MPTGDIGFFEKVEDNVWQTLLLLLTILPEGMLDAMLAALLPFMLRLAVSEQMVGFCVGYISSAFYLPLLVMNYVWGATADRYGRYPVLIAGLVVMISTSLYLSFATTFWGIFIARFVAGIFGANSTIAKGTIGLIHQDNSARAVYFALYSVLYGGAGLVGPVLAGLLAEPAKQPNSGLAQWKFFQDHPYSLPPIVAAMLGGFVLAVSILFFKEPSPYKAISVDDESDSDVEIEDDPEGQGVSVPTGSSDRRSGSLTRNEPVRRAKRSRRRKPSESAIASPDDLSPYFSSSGLLPPSYPTSTITVPSGATKVVIGEEAIVRADRSITRTGSRGSIYGSSSRRTSSRATTATSRDALLEVKPTLALSNIYVASFLYSLIALCQMTYVTATPLLLSSSVANGGLGFPAIETGILASMLALSKLFTQIFVFAPVHARLGTVNCYRFGMGILVIPLLASPLLYILSNTSLWFGVITFQLLLGLGEGLAYLSALIIITDSSGGDSQGTGHGFASALAAGMRAFAPTVAGSLWSISHIFVFIICGAFAMVGLSLGGIANTIATRQSRIRLSTSAPDPTGGNAHATAIFGNLGSNGTSIAIPC
ncbi:hypothetical protein SeLEV6574_g02208 [Synchytrium endobioticum]|uniref:Major facilitator superfamily (MFS) profile domain-containing protein n=1 Tax=Synchytrium endobioticum TaxID=286115 RepID=A0A507D9T7_9FUNG|nr:hypothetical protein SeLEV6574_g02208 [Synchytrium endobioticum]